MAPVDADLIAELEELVATQEDPEGYHTVAEWCDMADMGQGLMRTRFRVAKKMGRLHCRRVMREALDGTNRPVPAYRILPA